MHPYTSRKPAPGTTSGRVFYARTIGVLTLVLLGYLIYRIVQPVAVALLWALLLGFLLHPLHTRLTGHLRGHPTVSALLLTLATVLFVAGPLAGLTTVFAAQSAQLLENLQDIASAEGSGLEILTSLPIVGPILEWLQEVAGIPVSRFEQWLEGSTGSVFAFLVEFSRRIFVGAVGTATDFTLAMFMLFFIIRDGPQLLKAVRGLIPLRPARKRRLLNHLGGVTRALVYGVGLTALAQGALVGLAFWVLGLPMPVVFGALAGLFGLLPIGGSALVWGPAAAALAIQQRWIAAGLLLGWGALIVGSVDNLLRPMVVSGRAHIGTLTVFVGVLGGVSAFGATGLFAGPLVLALAGELIRSIMDDRLPESDPAPGEGR